VLSRRPQVILPPKGGHCRPELPLVASSRLSARQLLKLERIVLNRLCDDSCEDLKDYLEKRFKRQSLDSLPAT
jgi:hypothetical protein